jgi:hypothetical protein
MVAGNFLLFLLPHTLQIVIQYIFKRSKCYNLKRLGSHEEPGGVHTEEGAGGDVAVARGALGVLPAPTVPVLKIRFVANLYLPHLLGGALLAKGAVLPGGAPDVPTVGMVLAGASVVGEINLAKRGERGEKGATSTEPTLTILPRAVSRRVRTARRWVQEEAMWGLGPGVG